MAALEPGTVRNVPNGSEFNRETSPVGRPPRLTDSQLEHEIELLHTRLARMPTLDEISRHAGGCQRARAVKARKAFALRIRGQQAKGLVALPENLQIELSGLLSQWLTLARQQVGPLVDEITHDCEERVTQAEELMALAMARQIQVEEEREALAQDNARLQEKTDRLEKRCHRLALSEARWKTKAVERLERLTVYAEGDSKSCQA
jgi:hypothetical protein